jgi:hypothetical protein
VTVGFINRISTHNPLMLLRRNRPCCSIAGEQVRRRATPRLLLEIDVGKLLPVSILHDEASLSLFGRPRRRESALSHFAFYHHHDRIGRPRLGLRF